MSIKAINSKEVAKKVINKEELFILDVRNADEFEDWKIEGDYFQHLNVPYFELLDGVDGIMDQIPDSKEILVTCAKETQAS